MANLKSLAKDTAIYGMSSIIGRFLNYLLYLSIQLKLVRRAVAMVLSQTSMPILRYCWSF